MASNIPSTTTPLDQIAPTSTDVELAVLPISNERPPSKEDDPFLVAFNPTYDADNPKDWPSSRKWAVTDVLSATGFNRIMVSTIMAPALGTIARELHMSTAESVMAMSIYLLATAFGPLVIGPLSEVYGRTWVLHVSNVWFLVWNIACGFANTKELLIGARFLAGFGASAIYALSGGVLGDVWRPEQRGKSLGKYLLIPVLGAAVGPIIGGFMAGRTTWRWMFWSTSIFQAVMALVSFSAFHESYEPLILRRRAEKLRKDTGDSRYYTVHERFVQNISIPKLLGRTISRPMRLLIFHPIIQIMSLIEAFFYGLLYIMLSSFSDMWIQHYGVSVELSGLHYLAIALGEMAGAQLGGMWMDRYYRRKAARHPGREATPEDRIPPFASIWRIIPTLGLIWYGWTIQYRVHWAVVDVAMFLMMFGMQIAGMNLSAYVIDAYPEHTSSATAASQFLRSLTAFLFPLFTPAMYGRLGYGWGNTMLAFAGLLIGVPAPLLVWKYGARLRAKAASSW
ncbi:major facilitator superfamily domain-containing protein [Lophiotrema nucula]|uniref:Major facilitator superfamily domain-containing protein n=1 Tax=Lophiotrema nucula TaxID=690887 RepID=A0A6A5ZKG1_9PLEO|nr:major facilitator superfamily domain-containing protein [Lophiotrema nucula]